MILFITVIEKIVNVRSRAEGEEIIGDMFITVEEGENLEIGDVVISYADLVKHGNGSLEIKTD